MNRAFREIVVEFLFVFVDGGKYKFVALVIVFLYRDTQYSKSNGYESLEMEVTEYV